MGATTTATANADRQADGSIETERLRRMITIMMAMRPVITSANRLPTRWPASTAASNITMTPANATTLATSVVGLSRSAVAAHAMAAVMNGKVALITRTSATVVRRSALMKQIVASVEQ